MWVIVHSPFGKALQAIRDNEVRAEFVGVQVRRYRYVAFLVSGAFTGLAGALWVPLNGLTTPDILYWPFSGRIVFMAVLGGFRTFWGPIVGALRVQLPRGVGGRHHRVLAAGPRESSSSRSSSPCRPVSWGPPVSSLARLRRSSPIMSLLEVRNITKSFGDNRAVDDVSLTIRKGEFLGLIGSNGAGKTTLVNLISGFFPADRGALVFDGQDITRQSINERIRVGIARSFQLVNLFDQLTVLDNVALTIFARQGKTRWLWTLADRDGAVRDEARRGAPPVRPGGPDRDARRSRLAGRAEAPRRRGGLRAPAEAPVPRRADERRQHPGEGADHGHHHRRRARGGDHGGGDRARHGHRVPLLRPHRRHAPGRDPRLRHAGRDPAERAGAR